MGIEGIENLTETHTPIVQDQPKYTGEGEGPRDKVLNLPEKPGPQIPLEEGTVEKAQAFEEQRKSDLDKARELHNRVTAGEDPEDVRKELASQ